MNLKFKNMLLLVLLLIFVVIVLLFFVFLQPKNTKQEREEFKIGDIVAIVDNDCPFEEKINYLLIVDKAKGLKSDKVYYKWRFCDKYGNFIYSDNPKVDNLSYYTKVGHTDFESEQ